MLIISVLIFCVVGLGLLAMGYKYMTAEPPMDYHAEILSGIAVTDEMKLILGALYKSMGGAFLALGLGTILIALTGVRADMFMAKLTLLVMTCTVGFLTTRAARHVQIQSNIKTPWRIAAVLTVVSLFGFLLSLF